MRGKIGIGINRAALSGQIGPLALMATLSAKQRSKIEAVANIVRLRLRRQGC